MFSHTFLTEKLIFVLEDLYRIGFIGNYLNNKTATQWEYKEKYSLLIDAPWNMIVHPSLHVELSVSGRKDKAFNSYINNQAASEHSQPFGQDDMILTCVDCGAEFVFSAGEQAFFAERGFINSPKRCENCRAARKEAARAQRVFYTVKCFSCGADAKVPFEPILGKPVYCSKCFVR